jgi:hypothetical protein
MFLIVTHEQLQRVLPGLERQLGLGLATTKVQLIKVVGDWRFESGQLSIDQ